MYSSKKHPTAIINEPVIMGENVDIREFAVIGATPVIFENFKRLDAPFGVEIGNNVYIGPHATIMKGLERLTRINNQVIIGQYCNIGHDCIIDNRVKLIANVFLCGYVEVGEGTTIHAGTTVMNRIKIGKNCVIGQASNVVNNIPDDTMAFGNPCVPQRELKDGKGSIFYRGIKKFERMTR